MSNRHSQQITADILCVIGESDRGGVGITKIEVLKSFAILKAVGKLGSNFSFSIAFIA